MSRCEGEGCTHPDHQRTRGYSRDGETAHVRDRDFTDPVVKTDGAGRQVRASEMGLNRAARRQLMREAQRELRRAMNAARRRST